MNFKRGKQKKNPCGGERGPMRKGYKKSLSLSLL
jgi:hypothetical protein